MGEEPDRRIGEDDPEYEREQELARRRLLRRTWIARNNLYIELFGEPAYVSPANYSAPPPVIQDSSRQSSSGAEPTSDSTAPARVKKGAKGKEKGQVPGKSSPNKQDSSDTADPGDGDPSEQNLAVLAYGPDPLRPYWTYVTAGVSSPWVQSQPQEVSGFGIEFMIKSPTDHPFAPQLLRTMAFYIFNHAGVISPGVRIGLNGPIVPNSESLIRNAIIWYADEAPDCWYQLPSGGFGLFLAIGITEAECQYAQSVEKYGTWCIEQLLRRKGIGQVTDPNRACTMSDDDTPVMLQSIKMFADTFRQNEESMELGMAQPGSDFSF
jgi:hypothetical protein